MPDPRRLIQILLLCGSLLVLSSACVQVVERDSAAWLTAVASPPTSTPSPRQTHTPTATATNTPPPLATATATATAAPRVETIPTITPTSADTEPQPNPPTPTPLSTPPASLACVGHRGFGLSCLINGNWQSFNQDNSGLEGNNVGQIALCPDNELVFIHGMALQRFDGVTWYESERGWGSSSVADLLCDETGSIWVAHFGGVSRYNGQLWETFSATNFGSEEARPDLVNSIALAPDNRLWVLTSGSLAVYDGTSWQSFEEGQPFTERYFFRDMAINNNGDLWIAHSRGLLQREGQEWQTHEFPELLIVRDMLVTAGGQVWLATSNKGLWRFDGQNNWQAWREADGQLSTDTLSDLHVDPQGRLWIGSAWGLNVLHNGVINTYGMYTGSLASNQISDIAVAGSLPILPAPARVPPGQLSGQLVQGSTPLANARLEICVEAISENFRGETPCADQPLRYETQTDANGNFVFKAVLAGHYAAAASLDGNSWIIIWQGSNQPERLTVQSTVQTQLLPLLVPSN